MRYLLPALTIAFWLWASTALANAPPVAEATSPSVATVGEVLQFDATGSFDPDGHVTTYRWRFGDGATAEGLRVRHTYGAPGSYLVTLSVEDDSGAENGVGQTGLTVRISDAPKSRPELSAGTDRHALPGEILTFEADLVRGSREGTPTFLWQFGDGEGGRGQKVRYAYPKPGVYTVSVVAVPEAPLAERLRAGFTVTVAEPGREPAVANAGPDRIVAPGERLDFVAGDTGVQNQSLLAYRWDFGDASFAEGAAVTHSYAKPGRYPVRLAVTNGDITTEDTAIVLVNTRPTAKAGLDFTSVSSTVRLSAAASSDKEGEITQYRWMFPEGTTAEGRDVTHTFANAGENRVRLLVRDASGASNDTDEDILVVTVTPPPLANAGPDLVAAPGETLMFDARGDVDGVMYQWAFSDGEQASGPLVQKSFGAPGLYTVGLTAQDPLGGYQTDEALVRINRPPVPRPGPDRLVAPGEEVVFDASTSFDEDGVLTRHIWRFGDGYPERNRMVVRRSFGEPGLYPVALEVVDDADVANSSAAASITVRVNARPLSDAGEDILTSERTVTFDASRSTDADGDGLTYVWDFGDGQTAKGRFATNTFRKAGSYNVSLTVDDGTGLSNSRSTDSLTVRINRSPVAIAGEDREICAQDVVSFDANRSFDPDKDPLRILWDFGDGTKDTATKSAKAYEKSGLYPITLIVDDGLGSPNSTHVDRIFVDVSERPSADAGPDRAVCVAHPVVFDGSGSTDLDGVVNSYAWDFGDGNKAAGERIEHSFLKPGRYQVALTVEGDPLPSCDPVSVDWAFITVEDAPVAAFTMPQRAAVGERILLDASASQSGLGRRIDQYSWDFGDGTAAEGVSVEHSFDVPGAYTVRLSVSTRGGEPDCRKASLEKVIVVNAPPVAQFTAPGIVRVGDLVQFDASDSSDPDGRIGRLSWNFGDGSDGTDGTQVEHVYEIPGTYRVELTATDASGTASDRAVMAKEINVVSPGKSAITPIPASCIGEPVRLTAKTDMEEGSDGATIRRRWNFGDGVVADGLATSHIYRRTGSFTVTMTDTERIMGERVIRSASLRHRVNAPPVLMLDAPPLACPGKVVHFSVARSFDPEESQLSASWDFGDGETASGIRVKHRFAVPGTHWVTVRIDDGAGTSCSVREARHLVRVNRAPNIDAGSDSIVAIGGATDYVDLDASASSDPDGDPLLFVWTFPDGTSREGARIRTKLEKEGLHRIRLLGSDLTDLPCGIGTDTVEIETRPQQRVGAPGANTPFQD